MAIMIGEFEAVTEQPVPRQSGADAEPPHAGKDSREAGILARLARLGLRTGQRLWAH